MKNKYEGSISIFLTLCLLPMVLCAGLIIDAFKIATAKTQVANADELASNAIATMYDKDLYETYGLFAIDKNNIELSTLGGYYFGANLLSTNVSFNQNSYSRNFINGIFSKKIKNDGKDNLTNISPQDFNVTFDKMSSISNPTIFEKQIKEHMKLRGPLYLSEGILEKANVIKTAKDAVDFNNNQKKRIKEVEGELKNIETISEKINPLRQSNFSEDLKILKSNINNPNAIELAKLRNKIKALMKDIEDIKKQAQKYYSKEKTYDKSTTKNYEIQVMDKDYLKIVDEKEAYLSLIKSCDQDLTFLRNLYKKSAIKDFTLTEKDFIYDDLNVTKNQNFIQTNFSATAEEKKQAKEIVDNLKNLAKEKDKILGKNNKNINTYISKEKRNAIYGFVNLPEEPANVSQNLISKINIAGQKAYDNLLVTEYLSKFFPCETDVKGIDGRFGESEYILWGKENLDQNIALTQSAIFAIRLAANSLYIFSNPLTRQKALALATALSSAVGIGLPAVQYIILFTWSVAESIIDLISLSNGDCVPIFKNSKTLALSPEGINKIVGKTLKDLRANKIDDIYDYVTNLTMKNIDKAEKTLYDYSDNLIESKAEQILSFVVTPVEQKITSLVYLGTNKLTPAQAEQQINKIFDSQLNKISNNKNSKVTQIVLQKTKAEFSQKLGLSISNLRKAILEKNQKLINEEKSKLEKIKTEMVEKTKNQIYKLTNPVIDGFRNNVKEIILNNRENICDSLDNQIKNFQKNISKIETEKVVESTNESGGGLGLTYKEYLKIFTYVSLKSNSKKQKMLSRASECIDINMRTKISSFNVVSHYTSWSDTVSVNVNTIFISMFDKKYRGNQNANNFYRLNDKFLRSF
ncbi:MAG: DUF5702 domain-containing protein [Clostridia bacterium]|nr:DUF5702 domain-containing protein [Clostridia bacterium]